MEKPIEQYTDSEILAVLRKAENANLSGSLYQRAQNEWQIRQQQKLVEVTKSGRGGVFSEVGGDMKNDGIIQTGKDASVNIAVGVNYSSEKGKIIQGNFPLTEKNWYEKPSGIILLMVIGGIIVGAILYMFDWV